MWKRVISVLAGGILLVSFAGAPAASASATGTAFFGFMNAGNYTVAVAGSGTSVPWIYGAFTNLVTPVCNWDISAEFFDANWNWTRTFRTPVHSGCTRHDGTTVYANYTGVRGGHVCSTLRSNSANLASRCFTLG